MADPTPQWTKEELSSDAVSRIKLVKYLKENGSAQFIEDHKLGVAAKNIAKNRTKEELLIEYDALFATKSFKKVEEEIAPKSVDEVADVADKTAKLKIDEPAEKAPEAVGYIKKIIKKGDKLNFPRKGDTVSCFYTGKLEDGTVFDQNAISTKRGKKAQPLRFKVGKGHVIKAWDHALLTMSSGEKAELEIEPAWAYGKKGLEGKIPPNTKLHFEVELVCID